MGTTDPPLSLDQAPGTTLSAPAVEVRSHPDCLLHSPPPGHPDAPGRLEAVLEELGRDAGGAWHLDTNAELPLLDDILGTLSWVHERSYIARFRETAERGSGTLDSDDCFVSPGSFDAAVAGAGLSLGMALDLVNGRLTRGFVAARPPGHHAERERARGYCFFNQVALAAEVIVRAWNAPVLVVDIDSYHGNGIQEHFYRRGDVGYVSVHAFPAFPGTGGADEVGEGPGVGTTRNVPLAVGSGDVEVSVALEAAVEEVGSALRPAAILVAAGFSGHAEDPVGAFELSDDGFATLTRVITQAATAWSEGRVLSILEGGYAPAATARCARIHVLELAQLGWTY